MTFRNQLFCRYPQSRYADAWKAYKEVRRSVNQLLKNAECDHIRTEVQSHRDNLGSLWKIINTCIPSKVKETPVYSRDTELVADDFNQEEKRCSNCCAAGHRQQHQFFRYMPNFTTNDQNLIRGTI